MQQKNSIAIDINALISAAQMIGDSRTLAIDLLHHFREHGELIYSSITVDGRIIQSPITVINGNEDSVFIEVTDDNLEYIKNKLNNATTED